jgi:hypothetical protein
MPPLPFTLNPALQQSSRLAAPAQVPVLAREIVVVVLAGLAAAACTMFLDFNLRIPGHAILRAIIPIALGMSLAPRRLSGTLITASAFGGVHLFRFGAEPPGQGAMTSLLLAGPVLDAALWQTSPGWRLYARAAAAGLLVNVLAFAVRGGGKLASGSLPLRPWSQWLSVAPVTYAVCGLLAGLVAAGLWFRWTPRGNAR